MQKTAWLCLTILAGAIAFLLPSARAQEFLRAYDETSGIYFVPTPGFNILNPIDSMIYPDGRTEHFDPQFRPLQAGTPSPDIPSVVKFMGRTGLLRPPQTFLTLDAGGRMEKHEAFDQGIVPCEGEVIPARCVILATFASGSLSLVIVVNPNLGTVIYEWNGSRYVRPLSQLSFLNSDDLGGLFFGTIRFLSYLQQKILIPKSQFEPDLRISIFHAERREEIMVPLRQGPVRNVSVAGQRVIGDALYLIYTSANGEGAARVSLNDPSSERVLTLEKTLETIQEPFTWLGLDAQGIAYGLGTESKTMFSIDLASGRHRTFGSCERSPLFLPPPIGQAREDAGVWIVCGPNLLFAQNEEIKVVAGFASPIENVFLSSVGSEALSGIVDLNDGTTRLLREGAAETVDSLRFLRSQASTLRWRDGGRWCQLNQNIKLVCLENGAWISDPLYPLPSPVDLLETAGFTWYLAVDGGQVKLWRRRHGPSDSWHLLFAGAASRPSLYAKLFLTAQDDQIGLMGGGEQLKLFNASGESVDLPIPDRALSEQRPTIDGHGWLYGVCSEGTTCSFDARGNRVFSSPASQASRTFFPLERGTLILEDIGTDPLILFEDRSILLSKLYGQFTVDGIQPSFLALPRGQLLIAQASKDEKLTVYSFNGRQLTFLEKLPGRIFLNRGSPRFPQIWREADGLWWRAGMMEDEMPQLASRSVIELLRDRSVNPNSIVSAASYKGEAVFAGDFGLSFCPESSGVRTSSALARIDRAKGCRHQFLALPIQEVFADDELGLYLLSGSNLYRYEAQSQSLALVLAGIQSPRLAREGASLLYANASELRRYSLVDGSDTSLARLPPAVDGSSLLAFDAFHLCSPAGLYQLEGDGWRLALSSCRTGLRDEDKFWAATEEDLVLCENGACSKAGALPPHIENDFALGKADDLLFGSGRQISRFTSGTWETCVQSWALGSLPLGNVARIQGSWILTRTAGAMREACSAAPEIFRIF